MQWLVTCACVCISINVVPMFPNFKIHFIFVQSSCSDSRRDTLTDPGSAQINSHDELPTIPSDELLYACVSFQKHKESLSEASV